MTTRTDEVNPRERRSELLALKREQRSEVTLFAAEPGCKPLVDFDALPATTALPLTWGIE
jgi:hypothetical protein